MKAKPLICSLGLAVVCIDNAFAAGPYSPTNWPPTIDPAKKVHYAVADSSPSFTVPNDNWTNSLFWVGPVGSDSTFVPQLVCSPIVALTGNKATGNLINIADFDWQFWNTQENIDILVQVYGDDTVMIPPALTGTRVWRFREGTTGSTLPCAGDLNSITVNGAAVATNLHNFKWNWLLFSITNRAILRCGTNTGNRWVGSVAEGSVGNTAYGGINGGTMRMQPQTPSVWTGLIIHALAWGETGAFGNTSDINQFEPADVIACDPVPDQNLVGIDFNAGVTNYLKVMNDSDQTVTFTNSAGPAGSFRKAVIPDGPYLSFGILSYRLGKACNPNIIVKVCVDFYDDPAFAGAGVLFGPESYAADGFGGACAPNGVYPSSGLYSMQGTGKWVRKSWTIAGVNLFGVNTPDPLTGGPRFVSLGGQVAVSRFEMAALRTTGPLAGLDPLADCRPDPLVCEDAYGNYAELDLANGITNGLDLGTQSSDQAYVVETAGPAGDLRTSVRNADGTVATYLNFRLLTNALGPVSQGNARLAIAVTYFDDPALAGRGLRPQTWKYDSNGVVTDGFLNAPQDNIILQGSNTWREAYWEIGRITFNGVNQSPYAATRFQAEFGADTTKKIHISRVRYAVIRDCGTNAGVNLLATNLTPVKMAATPDANGLIKLSWPYHAPQVLMQSVTTLGLPWANFPAYNPGVATVEGGETRVFNVTNNADSQFFRLRIPSVP